MSETTGSRSPIRVETRSIDWIPTNERHGKPWHQGPFWFSSGFTIVGLSVGFIGPSLGLGLWWSLAADALGMAVGTIFMALHASQGPKLGMPQMLQSRAQFGVQGAIFPIGTAIFVYIGYNVFSLILAKDIVGTVMPGGDWIYVVTAIVAFLVATFGYDLLHVVERWLSYIVVPIFVAFTVCVIVFVHGRAAVESTGGAHWAPMLIQFAAACAYQISGAVYVSDYSRYLPENTPSWKVVVPTYIGSGAATIWMGSLGVVLASFIASPDPVTSVQVAGNKIIPQFGEVTLFISLLLIVAVMAENCYGAMLCGTSIIDGFHRIDRSTRVRIAGITVASAIGLGLTYAMPATFLNDLNTFLSLLVYSLVPWSVINLVDFYLVRRGSYSIADFFNPHGSYGKWAWRGVLAYFIGFAAMVPFFDLSFYHGPVNTALHGADLSFVVGLLVTGVLYYVLATRRERVTAAASYMADIT